jgi:two-component system cell cycle sensor histidine kinase/response regulator CckA
VDQLRVLLVEDSEDDAALLERHLRGTWSKLLIHRVETTDGLRAALASGPWDVLISDYGLPSMSALDSLTVLHESGLDIPLLVASGTLDEEKAVEVLRAGARDFLSKGRWARLAPAIIREQQEARTRHARRSAEQQLIDVLERAAFAQKAAGVGTWEYDMVRDITTWSPIFEALHGLPEGVRFDGSETEFVPLVHPDDCSRVLEHCHNLCFAQGDHQITYRVIWPDRSVHWVAIRGRTFVDDSGAVVRAAGIGLDVTAQQELEENLRQANKMESVGNLAGGIAHDFNNLLTVITGYGELLSEQLADQPDVVADLNEILRASRSATVMTRQLLAFSRRQVLRPQVVDLATTVSDLKVMLHRLIESNISLSFNLANQETPVRVDPGQIEQVLLNLVVNARDAMPKGGTLTVQTEVTEVRAGDATGVPEMDPGTYVRLIVRDTGTGIPPEVRSRMFEPFFTTKDAGRGTGLGLATVYGIVQQSEGYLGVDSEVGKGTAFQIYLPFCRAPLTVTGPSAAVKPALPRGFTMLVVEDNPSLRVFCERAIRELGGQPLMAESAEEAMSISRANPATIAMALVDIMMPGVGGTAVGEWLRSHSPQTQIIYTSGYSQEELTRHGMGPDDNFIAKPFTKASLQGALQAAFRSA